MLTRAQLDALNIASAHEQAVIEQRSITDVVQSVVDELPMSPGERDAWVAKAEQILEEAEHGGR